MDSIIYSNLDGVFGIKSGGVCKKICCKEHVVIDLGATEYDLDADIVCGFAQADSQVDVEVDALEGYTAYRFVPTDAGGRLPLRRLQLRYDRQSQLRFRLQV